MTETSTSHGAARPPARRGPTSKLSTAQRAVIAAHLSECGLKCETAANVVCVNATYVRRVRRLSERDRFRLIDGEISLSQLCNHRRRRPISDGRIRRFIERAGPGRVMGALDEMTAPTAVAAE